MYTIILPNTIIYVYIYVYFYEFKLMDFKWFRMFINVYIITVQYFYFICDINLMQNMFVRVSRAFYAVPLT